MPKFESDEQALEYIEKHIPWGVAAGVCKDAHLAERYAQAGMSLVTYGSITLEQRSGNEGSNFYYDGRTGNSINALGIPNKGFAEHLKELPAVRKAVNAKGAKLCVSISAGNVFDEGEYHEMARQLSEADAADIIEGNFSCGNMLLSAEKYKPIVCYDILAFDSGVEALKEGAGDVPVAVKLTPTTEQSILTANLNLCLKYGVEYVVLANTIPNSYLEQENREPAISMGRGGLGGRALIPVVTGMVQMARQHIGKYPMKIIAAGGIECGRDAFNYLRHGADGFEMSTLLWANDFDASVAQKVIMGNSDDGKNKPGLIEYLCAYGLPG